MNFQPPFTSHASQTPMVLQNYHDQYCPYPNPQWQFRYPIEAYKVPADSPPPYSVAPPLPAPALPSYHAGLDKNTTTVSQLSLMHPPSIPFPEQEIRPPTTLRIPKVTQPAQSKRTSVPHPYARLFARKDEVKRRRIWNHVHEKHLFTPYELSTVRAPHRRVPYIASLEAHIDTLHDVFARLGNPVATQTELDQHTGLNFRTAKSKVSSLQHEVSVAKLKMLELERANADLERQIANYRCRQSSR